MKYNFFFIGSVNMDADGWINRVRELSAKYITARDNSYSKRIMYLRNYKNEGIR